MVAAWASGTSAAISAAVTARRPAVYKLSFSISTAMRDASPPVASISRASSGKPSCRPVFFARLCASDRAASGENGRNSTKAGTAA